MGLLPDASNTAHSLYVIRKQRRSLAKKQVTPLRMYYILDGVVFEVPSLQAVLRARLMHLGWLLEKAFEAWHDALAQPEATSDSLQTKAYAASSHTEHMHEGRNARMVSRRKRPRGQQ